MDKKFKLIFLLNSFVLMALMAAGFFVVWNKVSSLAPQGEKASKKAAEGENVGEVIGPIFSLDTFIVNLADKGGRRYLRVTMDLELSDGKVTKELEKRLPQVRNAILMILPTKRFEDISSLEGKIALRDEIIAKLNSFLKSGTITNLYYTEFVIQ